MSRKTKVFGPAAARRRALETLPAVGEELPTPIERCVSDARAARHARKRYHVLEERTVRNGRKVGISWDELGDWLTVSGETLRRRYGRLTED